MNYATGYQTKTITVTADGTNTVNFATVAVTAQINDPDSTDIAAATVEHAGNTGTYGSKIPVDANGDVTFQVLPGTNTFTGWDGTAYSKETLTVTAATATSITVQ
jgi:VCBS repeat-containing protein